ncbi:two component transcriptional regulator, winged helix family [Gloeothece citriformis PCC 7424]|uniref:Two component transcriptional regulator, winged helix family n=1 Tax=Gloeothece citriformis (strain PCC 7424) TaxID=65393 RepID=B7KIH0_GLOC7|nr:response regulator transcription factor [Gloeothece citriformis]ACK69376.1 two component transcriptional regulator, winged helix family [Gloeothece citriformis PCC 7424]
MITPCILLVQTDEVFNQQASLDLKEAGYHPVIVPDLKTARSEYEVLQPAMIVLDRKRTGEAGVKFCRQLRQSGSRVYILMLVEQETVEERVACLEAGADDYLLNSNQLDPLRERVHFYLQPTPTVKEQLRFAEMVLDLSTRRLLINDKEIDLTMKEFELLKYLMSHPREVLTREQILENVWGFDFRGESNVIEVYVRYLRLKMENEGQKRLIHTVRGVGYVLRET